MDGEKYDEDLFREFGFGTQRTLRDYEKYAGILFEKRAVQQETLDKRYPPNTYNYNSEEEWKDSFASIFKHCIDLYKDSVPYKDYDFWVVAFHDDDGNTIIRLDANKDEVTRIMSSKDNFYKIWREFPTTHKPAYWVVWPHSESKGWCEKIEGRL